MGRNRGIDTEPGWINRKFKALEADMRRLASAKRLESSSVAGGVVTIREILTNPGVARSFLNTDTFTGAEVTAGPVVLSHVPIEGSEHVKWLPINWPSDGWTRSGRVLTVLDPDGFIDPADTFEVDYAYDATGQPASLAGAVLLDWGSTGPNLIVTEGDMTDYSAAAFDDSGWTSAAGAVGYPLGPNAGAPSWTDVVTVAGSADAGVWMRRDFELTTGATVSVSARSDGQWWLYCDGVLLGSDPAGSGVTDVGPFEVVLAGGDHVIALHVNDDTSDPGAGDFLYADVNVVIA